MRISFLTFSIAIALCLMVTPRLAVACSSCNCAFNSEWASEGYSPDPGFRFDVRYDYIKQRELREGSRSVPHSDFTFPNDREVQQHTITRATTLGFDYSTATDWGFRALVPFIDRTHTTIMEGETETSGSATLGIGDIQLIARYQGFTPESNLGVQFGIKLPSGTFTDRFNEGSDEAGSEEMAQSVPVHEEMHHPEGSQPERIDRGLQNGTGTTDVILGIYKFGNLMEGTEYFTQIMGYQPLAERSEFRMGTALNASVGASYKVSDAVKPQIQLTYRVEAREKGEEADHANSGGQFLKLAPGVTFYPGDALTVYTIVEVPLTQDVNGLQLVPQTTYSVGMRYSF